MKRRLPAWAAPILVQALAACARAFPGRAGLRLFSWFGSLAFRLDRTGRSRALQNLALAFPDGDAMILAAMARGSYIALARNARDALRLRGLSRDQILDLCAIDGEEHLWEACHAGKGVIALTGRIGCWELVPAYLSCKDYRVSVMFDDLFEGRAWRSLAGGRARRRTATLVASGVTSEALGVLERGEVLVALFEGDAGPMASTTTFFGAPARVTRQPAALAARSGAAVVPMAIHMQPDGSHRVTVLPVLSPPEAGLTELERIDEYSRRAALAIESLIRVYPQQWVWPSPMWRGKEGVDWTGSSSEPV
jgi:lauroyl/myristoyl acyltransferase